FDNIEAINLDPVLIDINEQTDHVVESTVVIKSYFNGGNRVFAQFANFCIFQLGEGLHAIAGMYRKSRVLTQSLREKIFPPLRDSPILPPIADEQDDAFKTLLAIQNVVRILRTHWFLIKKYRWNRLPQENVV